GLVRRRLLFGGGGRALALRAASRTGCCGALRVVGLRPAAGRSGPLVARRTNRRLGHRWRASLEPPAESVLRAPYLWSVGAVRPVRCLLPRVPRRPAGSPPSPLPALRAV